MYVCILVFGIWRMFNESFGVVIKNGGYGVVVNFYEMELLRELRFNKRAILVVEILGVWRFIFWVSGFFGFLNFIG